uniref:G_PROTEIN_RECEP_F1_2 domain-containing protein n=1 Tax=Heterorhabditis bacteriophora TaxID=37862 RepID=A0A1I7X9L1_HETBA
MESDDVITELVITSKTFILNALFLCVLRKYSVFHLHMRIICLNISVAVLLIIIYSLMRAIINLYQLVDNPHIMVCNSKRKPIYQNFTFGCTTVYIYTCDKEYIELKHLLFAKLFKCKNLQDVDDSFSCLFKSAVPGYFCIIFIIFPLVLVIERAFATEKYRDYEHSNFCTALLRICIIFIHSTTFVHKLNEDNHEVVKRKADYAADWIPLPFFAISNGYHMNSLQSILSCELNNIRTQSTVQRNVWYLITTMLNFILTIVLKQLTVKNGKSERESVTNRRSGGYTLSHRFQARENYRTCQFLVSVHASFCLTFVSFYAYEAIIINRNNPDVETVLFQKRKAYLHNICEKFCSTVNIR